MSDSVYEMARETQSTISGISNISKASVISKRSSFLSCRICLSSIHEAAALTCGHKFCERCLKQYWEAKDKPDFIICPLCRSYAFNVDFAKNDQDSTEEFRMAFNPLTDIAESIDSTASLTCIKISILVPAVYYLLKWLGVPIISLINFTPNE